MKIRMVMLAIVTQISATALCVAAPKVGALFDLEIGMTKAQVVQHLGPPKSVSAQGNMLVFRYTLWEGRKRLDGVGRGLYFVRLVNGRVESFGKWGDFDSTKPETKRVEVKVLGASED